MVTERKRQFVQELEEAISRSPNMVFTDFRGLNVDSMERLRRELYERGSRLKVVKNNLALRAFENALADSTAPAEEPESAETSEQQDSDESVSTPVEVEAELEDLPGVGPSKVEALEDEGFESVLEISQAEPEDLEEVSGVGPSTAEKLLEAARDLVPEQPEVTDDPDVDAELSDLPGVGPSKVEALEGEGFDSVLEVSQAEPADLEVVSGIGSATAEKLIKAAEELAPASVEQPAESDSDDGEEQAGSAGEAPTGLMDEVRPMFEGNTAVVFSGNGFVSMAEILVEFSEDNEHLELKGGLLEGEFLPPDRVEDISELPTRKELLASLAVGINQPIQKLVRGLAGPIQKLVTGLDQVKRQKEDE